MGRRGHGTKENINRVNKKAYQPKKINKREYAEGIV